LKKLKFVLPVVALLIAIFVFSGVALADDPTTVTVTWNGGGAAGVNVNSGDSNAGFNTGGDLISGTYTAVDSNDNPYSYSVDSFSSYLNANVTNGFISTGTARVNSYVSMYGAGGQLDTAFVGVTDGTASIAFRSTTNYAQMVDGTYTYQLPGGHNIVANAAYYEINRLISDGRGNSGEIQAWGGGVATLDCMSSEASGAWNLKLGGGAGCYTDANYQAVGGAGHFQVTGIGNDSVVFNGLGLSSGGGALSIVADWVNSFNIADYSLTAH
jgi:hypothetical protein